MPNLAQAGRHSMVKEAGRNQRPEAAVARRHIVGKLQWCNAAMEASNSSRIVEQAEISTVVNKIPDVMRALTKATTRRRKIHVDLRKEIHRKLRVKAALEDVWMQAYVARVVEKAVKDVPLPEAGNHCSGKGGA